MRKESHETNRPLEFMQSFWKLQKSIMGQVKQTALDNALSVPQFSILVMMHHHEQIPQKKLQERTHYPKSTLSHAIEALVQSGYLSRMPVDGNRREMDLFLNDSGKRLLEDMKWQENGVHTRFRNAVDSFTEEQFSELISMHQHIIQYFDGGDAT